MTQRDNKIGIERVDDMVVTQRDRKAVATIEDFCLISVSTVDYRLERREAQAPGI